MHETLASENPEGPGSPALGGELRAMARLAAPVVVVQVGLMAMGVVDTIMVGRVSAAALAAAALGNLYFINVSFFGMGTLMALDPLVSQALGARDDASVARAMQRGLVLTLALSLFTALALLSAGPVFDALRQPPEVTPDASRYVRITIWSVVPFLAFVVLRQSLQAMHRVAPIVVTIVGANVANVFLNWVLIFGKLGSPAMGVAGAAWATTLSRWLMAVALLALAWRELRPYLLHVRADAIRVGPILRMFRLGAPIGLQMTLEVSAFGLIGLLMGVLGAVELGAHQIAINLAATTFMVPLGVGAAAAVRVGRAVGAHDAAAARRAAKVALLLGVGFMCLTAVLFVSVPAPLARTFTPDTRVLGVAVLLIPIAGIFQVFDGIQAVAAGVLRGIGDTRAPLIVNLFGFWLLGVPISVYLGFYTEARAVGLWWGLVAGLGAVAAFLLLRIRTRMRRGLARVE
ncbi:MAG: MATE family efflux transporter [Gemmatimonadota bacterium]|nr:MATE family efflux transporter [Gemmatimonadota bacterium]